MSSTAAYGEGRRYMREREIFEPEIFERYLRESVCVDVSC